MKLVCSKAELSRVISLAQSAVSNKSTLPVLGNLLFEAEKDLVQVTATDLEIGLQCTADVEVVESGSVTIPAKKLMEIVRECPDQDIEINVTSGTKIQIKCGKVNFKIMGIAAEDFPNLPAHKKEKSIKLKDKTLQEMIKKTSFSVSNDETRYVLNGALLEVAEGKARMISTDGHRLSFFETEATGGSEAVSAVLPTKALNELAKILTGSDDEVTIDFTDNHLFVEKKSVTLSSRLIDGQFPNWEQVVPKKTDLTFTAQTADITQATKRVALMASDKSNSIKFSLKGTLLTITANTPDVGEAEEDLEVEYAGKELAIAFNARYLLDVFKVMEGDKLQFKLSSPLSPALVLPAGGDGSCKYVVMPMRT